MKKSLSLLVAIAMVFSMFATVAAAATTSEAKFEELKAAGIFDGMPDGSAGLDQEMTRAQFAKVIALLKGLTSNSPSVFTDVAEDHWAKGYIMAVYEAGIMEGVGNNKFAPSKNVTIQELLKVAVLVLGLEIDEDATVSGNASPWAQKYVAAAEKAGLIKPQADYTIPALRSVLVDVSYELYFEINGIPKVTGAEVVSSKKIVVTFSDGEQVEYELENALQPGANEVTVTYKDREYSVTVEYNAPAVDAKIVGAKKLEVAFNQAVDASKVKFTLKRGVNSVTIANTTWSDDKRTATLELASKFFEGDHELTVEGVDTEALKVSFKAEAERVAGIEILNDIAPVVDSNYDALKVYYKVVNQYGEDITSAISNINGTISYGSIKNISGGTVDIEAPAGLKFTIDSSVVVTLMHGPSNSVITKTIKVGAEERAAQVTIEGLYHEKGETLTTDSTFGEFYILVNVKDQYGNVIKPTPAANLSKLKSETVVYVGGTSGLSVDGYDGKQANYHKVTVNGEDKTALKLAGNNVIAGNTIVTIIAAGAVGGNSATYTINVADGLKAYSIVFGDPGIVAADDPEIKIPVVVTDKEGNEITNPDTLNSNDKGVQVIPSKGQFAKDGNSIVYKFQPTAADEGPLALTAVPKGNPINAVTQTFNIRAAANPKVITGLKDINALIYQGQSVDIDYKTLIVEDQYGRTMDADSQLKPDLVNATPAKGLYQIVVSDNTNSNVVSLTGSAFGQGGKVRITGNEKGTESVTFTLQEYDGSKWVNVSGSELTLTFRTVELSELSKFSAEDPGKIYSHASYTVDLKVFGETSDGKKVELPSSEYTVYSTDAGVVSVNGNTLEGKVDLNADPTNKEATLIVTIKNGSTFETKVTATNVKPTVSVLEVRDGNEKVTSLTISGPTFSMSNISSKLYVKDQYGQEAANIAADGTITFKDGGAPQPQARITISNLKNAGGSTDPIISMNGLPDATITGLETGDTFEIVISVGTISTEVIKVTVQ